MWFERRDPFLLEDPLALELPLVEHSLLEHHLGLSGKPLFEFASVAVRPELVVEEYASMLLLLELTLPVVGAAGGSRGGWAGVVGVVDGSPTSGGDWIGTPVSIIGGTFPRINPAEVGLPDDGGAFFSIEGCEVGAP